MSLLLLGTASRLRSKLSGASAARAQPAPSLLTTGSYLSQNVRSGHIFPMAVDRFRVAYGNFYNNNGVETDGPSLYTVRAAVEYPSGTYTPLFLNGSRDIPVSPGALVWFDPLSLSIPAATRFWVHTNPSVADTAKQWPILGPVDNTIGEGVVNSATNVDTTMGTISPAANGYGLLPFAIRPMGVPAGTPLLGVVGDSIAYGLQDTYGGRGWVGQAFDGVVACQKIDYASERAAIFNVTATRRRRMELLAGCNVGICAYGTNDIGFAGASLASVQAILQATWAILASYGMKVFQTTITPRTTSTDSWATPGNQTVLATESIRTQLNDWIRTTPAGLTGYIELADTVEVNAAGTATRNGGRWKTSGSAQGYTFDGIHPVAAGYTLMAVPATAAVPAITAAAA